MLNVLFLISILFILLGCSSDYPGLALKFDNHQIAQGQIRPLGSPSQVITKAVQENGIFIPVEINHVKLQLALATAWEGHMIISPAAAKKVGIKRLLDELKGYIPENEKVNTETVKVEEVKISEFLTSKDTLLVSRNMDFGEYDGFITRSDLQAFKITIDTQSKSVTLSIDAHSESDAQGLGKSTVTRVVLPGTLDGVKVDYLMDLSPGSFSHIYEFDFRQNYLNLSPPRAVMFEDISSLGKDPQAKKYAIQGAFLPREVAFGHVVIKDLAFVIWRHGVAMTLHDPVLGRKFLKDYQLVLNFPKAEFSLRPQGPARPFMNQILIDGQRVTGLFKGGPNPSKLRINDLILEGLEPYRQAAKENKPGIFKLLVEREGKKLVIEEVRGNLFEYE